MGIVTMNTNYFFSISSVSVTIIHKRGRAILGWWYLNCDLKIRIILKSRENNPGRAKLHKQIYGGKSTYVEYVW